MKKGIQIFAVLFFGMVLFLGCQKQNSKEEENPLEAMYIQKGDEFRIFVDPYGSPFYATIPEGTEELNSGDIVEIYGDMIMLESYPGQYPGVEKIVVKQKGSEEDTEQYAELIAELYTEPDPSEVPTLNLEYTTELARVSAVTDQGNFEWHYENENGEPCEMIEDAMPIMEWETISDIRLSAPTDVKLLFSKTPESVTATRYPEEEEVTVTQKDGQFVLENLQQAGIYQVTATYSNGTVEYGFQVLN